MTGSVPQGSDEMDRISIVSVLCVYKVHFSRARDHVLFRLLPRSPCAPVSVPGARPVPRCPYRGATDCIVCLGQNNRSLRFMALTSLPFSSQNQLITKNAIVSGFLLITTPTSPSQLACNRGDPGII